MGMTIEFYSAEPQEIQALFSARSESEDFDSFFEKLGTYSIADFSFHLHIPEDMDSLCQALRKQNGLVPPTFNELLVEQLWWDGVSESLTVLNNHFAMMLASMSASEIEQAALDWAITFPYQEPLQQTPAYKSLLQLREVALDVITRNRSLLFYLEGNPAFFRW
jgi:hypothetical protein